MIWIVCFCIFVCTNAQFQIFQQITKKVKQPFFASKIVVGKTVMNNDLIIYMLTKKQRHNYDQLKESNAILIDSYMHSRQPYSAQLVQKLYQKISNINQTDALNNFLQNGVIIFYPIVNIDGYYQFHKNQVNKFQLRKNMNTENRKCPSGMAGVDINRNFPNNFGIVSTSAQPCSEEYHGKQPFSQNEAKVFQKLFKDFNIVIAIDVHSYGNQWVYPYAHDKTAKKYQSHKLYPFYNQIEKQLLSRNKKVSGCFKALGYIADGVYIDWALDQGAFTYAYQVGTGFDSDYNIDKQIISSIDDFFLIFQKTKPNYEVAFRQQKLEIVSKSLIQISLNLSFYNMKLKEVRFFSIKLSSAQKFDIKIEADQKGVYILCRQNSLKQQFQFRKTYIYQEGKYLQVSFLIIGIVIISIFLFILIRRQKNQIEATTDVPPNTIQVKSFQKLEVMNDDE